MSSKDFLGWCFALGVGMPLLCFGSLVVVTVIVYGVRACRRSLCIARMVDDELKKKP